MKRFLLGCFIAAQCFVVVYTVDCFAGQDNLALPNNEIAPNPWLILQKAAQAARELSYEGIFIYQSGGSGRSVQITHMNYGQGEYARIVVLDGTPREVLSQGKDVVIFSPRNETVVIEKRRGQNLFPALLPSNMDSIKTSYNIKLGGVERVGGRDGQVINLDPRDQYRYGYKLWTDREYGLIIKAQTINEHHDATEQIAFSQLTLLNSQNMDWFQPNIDHDKKYVMEESPSKNVVSEDNTWSVSHLPDGYKKIDQVTRMVPGKPYPVTQLIFSDGLASVSLFIEPLVKGIEPKIGHTAMGATNFYANTNNGHQVVVVGEVPEATVTEIANAVTFKK
jgi:sigma-E factor negative regulatory protein RseB